MNGKKSNYLEIIEEYLLLSTIYGYILIDQYKERKKGTIYNLEYSVHGIGIHVIDKNKLVEIDFDYYDYDGKQIKYFDVWKLNQFSEKRYDIKFSREIIDKLIDTGHIYNHIDDNNYYMVK